MAAVVVIGEHELLELLRRAHAGEAPDVLWAEAYANSEHEYYPPPD